MQYIFIILTSLLISFGTFLGVYTLVPLSWFEGVQETQFGSTITTILGSDTLSSSRAVINTNFSNLNTDKLQSGDTAATLTITSGSIGTLTLTNPLTVANGGTGSTTLSANQVLLGNGTSNVKTPTGWGTTGQFLKSNGFGSAPSWDSASVNTTANFGWTGFHYFASGVDMVGTSSLKASVASKLTLNGLDYSWPLSHRSTSSPLVSDGAGALSWGVWTVIDAAPSSGTTALTSTTTLATIVIPADTLNTSNRVLRVTANGFNAAPSGGCYFELAFGTGSATSTMGYIAALGSGERNGATLVASISATSTTNQFSTTQGYASAAPTEAVVSTAAFMRAYHAVNTTAKSYIAIGAKTSASATCDLDNYYAEVLTP